MVVTPEIQPNTMVETPKIHLQNVGPTATSVPKVKKPKTQIMTEKRRAFSTQSIVLMEEYKYQEEEYACLKTTETKENYKNNTKTATLKSSKIFEEEVHGVQAIFSPIGAGNME